MTGMGVMSAVMSATSGLPLQIPYSSSFTDQLAASTDLAEAEAARKRRQARNFMIVSNKETSQRQ